MDPAKLIEQVNWIKDSLDMMYKAAADQDDPNCGSARKFIADMQENVDEWMEAHYGET